MTTSWKNGSTWLASAGLAGLALWGTGRGTAMAQQLGAYCSAALSYGNWGVLQDAFATPEQLCWRIQAQYLGGRYPDVVRSGYFLLQGVNRVSVNCMGPVPWGGLRVGIGNQPFYAAYDDAVRSGGQGCLFTASF